MKFSQFFAPTTKEEPKDCVLKSHSILIRGGFIKQIGSGIYSFLPLGKIVLDKVQKIIKDELDKSGANEVRLGFVTPADLWRQSKRFDKYGKELLVFKDRKDNDFVLGPTHEESIVDCVKGLVKSYKQLPLNLYQIHIKFRDEIRPRFGLMRAREFVMKDGYSFHADKADLDREFALMEQTYKNIFDRLGVKYRVVEADSGAIGGSGSKEFMVLADSGEDDIVVCEKCDYAANIEAAIRALKTAPNPAPQAEFAKFYTPNITTIKDLCEFLKIDAYWTMKCVAKKAIFSNSGNLGNLSLGGGNSSLELHSADSANFGRSQTQSLASRPKFAENHESQTENPSVVLNAESMDSSLRGDSTKSPKQSTTLSSLRGESQDSHEAIYESKMDCHDLTSSSLAMTGNYNAESTHDSTTQSPSNDKFAKRIKKLLITASGGAFRDLPLSEIPTQCAKNALKHPNWAMGRKITIDSATMINKLFEILEAKWLFGVENIDAVIERNSTIHALIQTNDNAIIAHLSANDMRLPIASALLGAKAKNKSFIKELDLMNLCIHFERIDINRYPLWRLKDALLKCPKLGIIINAANDILVAKFLENEIRFGDISNGIFAILDRFGDESALNAISNIAEIADLHAKIADFLKSY